MILLDTHAVLWFARDIPQLGDRSTLLAENARSDDRLFVSAFTFWELAMLAAKKRLRLGQPAGEFRQFVLDQGIREIPVSGSIGIEAVSLDGPNNDPADRIIAATALAHDATLITADRRLLDWKVPLRTHDARL